MSIRLHGTRSATFALHAGSERAEIELPLPGLYNVYNALGAATLCLGLGVGLETIAAGLAAVSRRLRPRRAGGDRRQGAVHPAHQESGGRQRDPAHAGARAR